MTSVGADFGELGVTARPVEEVETDLLNKVQRTREAKDASTTADGWESKRKRINKRLLAVQREAEAVRGALQGLETAECKDEDSEAAEGRLQADASGPGEADALGPEEASGAAKGSDDLQKAGLVQRLADLEAQETRLQGALDAMLEIAPDALPALAGGGAPQPVPASEAEGTEREEGDEGNDGGPNGLVETERDRLIRLGVLTPFDNLSGFERKVHAQQPSAAEQRAAGEPSTSGRSPEDAQHPSFSVLASQMAAAKAVRPRTQMLSREEAPLREKAARRIDERFWRQAASKDKGQGSSSSKHPGSALSKSTKGKRAALPKRRALKKLRKIAKRRKLNEAAGIEDPAHHKTSRRRLSDAGTGDAHAGSGDSQASDDYDPLGSDAESSGSDESLADEADLMDDDIIDPEDDEASLGSSDDDDLDISGEWDDADDDIYEQRRARYLDVREAARIQEDGTAAPDAPDVQYDGGYRIPANIYDRLFDYQKTGVKWMWELHTQRSGGIIGDEMGLGKTIQVAAFLAGLHHCKMFRPTLVICPATVMRQWLRELRAWYPLFRVVVLHESARAGHQARPDFKTLVRLISRTREGICITSYEQMRRQRAHLTGINWGYVVLDEGHKIRNPDAEVTLAAKQLATVHRIIMTGSPIQNRLSELWSLFDFVFPGKLGTLPVFQTQFALPIQIGGYANASAMQVSTAYKCAVVLRDLIAPYLLRRRKADVAQSLPKKTEQVLFTMLGPEQRDLYRSYLASAEVHDILEERRNALAGIDIMRKICNHPDLLQRAKWEGTDDYGNPKRSGKLMVALKVLEHWRATGHRVLLFTQTQMMLDILERAVAAQGMNYHRMDGTTPVAQRARLVDHFNADEDLFVFLLTTKVGGIGINLTGADRVMLYDPDWNPSTDMQARERAWRVGQQREVIIYRLITSGTIEEKVYHRQIYKQFLTNKVLSDPRQKRFFKSKDMRDLFTLGSQYEDAPETAAIFAGLDSEVALDPARLARPASASAAAAAAAAAAASGSADEAGLDAAVDDDEEDQLAAGPSGEPTDGDAGILRDLFEGTGIMGALDHSKIEGANDPGARSADLEAARVAKRAADALRKSRAARQADAVNVPTWTGRSGAGLGAAGKALRSQDLLARVRARQARVDDDGSSAADPQVIKAGELSRGIVAFLASKGGSAPSAEVVAAFADRVSQAELQLFRQVLQQVARLQRSPQGGSGKEWVLNPDFVPDNAQ
ncbi:hypothetical protein WJX73_007203 [Symbiochloris irregularis]|uniref:Uncharacterized protein n=1 Tax=Symbiochloris irregularis TaxID=706552 RepID=A0AAW1PMW5_9CHLO